MIEQEWDRNNAAPEHKRHDCLGDDGDRVRMIREKIWWRSHRSG